MCSNDRLWKIKNNPFFEYRDIKNNIIDNQFIVSDFLQFATFLNCCQSNHLTCPVMSSNVFAV